jgi:hypothetical protein
MALLERRCASLSEAAFEMEWEESCEGVPSFPCAGTRRKGAPRPNWNCARHDSEIPHDHPFRAHSDLQRARIESLTL